VQVELRDAVSNDAATVAAIYVESSNAAFAPYQPPRRLTDELVSRWRASLAGDSHRWWVAAVDSEIVGFAGVGPSRDPVEPGLGELDTIAVMSAWWRRGVGRALIDTASRVLDGDYRAAILWTWAAYEPAHRFYTQAGWRLDGGTRDHGRQVSFRRP
jgi:GNAT superfamily N-acetyltransferase